MIHADWFAAFAVGFTTGTVLVIAYFAIAVRRRHPHSEGLPPSRRRAQPGE